MGILSSGGKARKRRPLNLDGKSQNFSCNLKGLYGIIPFVQYERRPLP